MSFFDLPNLVLIDIAIRVKCPLSPKIDMSHKD